MKRSQPRRYWTAAREKIAMEDRCRLHRHGGCEGPLEAAHTVGRAEQDRHELPNGNFYPDLYVNPRSVIPLCRHHHELQHRHEVSVLEVLNLDEQLDAVRGAGGIALAFRRLSGSRHPEGTA